MSEPEEQPPEKKGAPNDGTAEKKKPGREPGLKY